MAEQESDNVEKDKPVEPAPKAAKKKKSANKKWAWTDDKVKALIDTLFDYKVRCEFGNIDFSSDLVTLYSEVRISLAKFFPGDFDFVYTF